MNLRCAQFAVSIAAGVALCAAMTISARSESLPTPPALTTSLVELSSNYRLVIVGEVHGSQEVPALILDAAREATKGDAQPLIVALEMPDRMASALDRFLTDDDPARARADMLADEFWTWRDGRSSEAMLALVTGLRDLKRDGRSISVVPFDASDTKGDAASQRDANMAINVRRLLADHPDSRILLLAGNYHARIAKGAPWDAQLEHMAFLLRDEQPLTLDARAPTGSVWVCTPDCGVYEFGKEAKPADASVRVFDALSDTGYRGEIVFPRFSASRPVIEANPE